MEQALTKQQIVNELNKSPHGELSFYVPVISRACGEDPEFIAHLIAWSRVKSQVRDSHVGLPVVSISRKGYTDPPEEILENSLAHIASLSPRELERAVRFALNLKMRDRIKNRLFGVVTRYLHALESNYETWERKAIQHREHLKSLYALAHVKPAPFAQSILMANRKNGKNYPRGSAFEALSNLRNMSATEAAGEIIKHKLPFRVAMGTLGARAKETDILLSLIQRMTSNELTANTKWLMEAGVRTVPALRAAFEQALGKAAKSTRNTLKATKAAEVIEEAGGDEAVVARLRALQEKQLAALGGVDGNWLILVDKSGSMERSIAAGRKVASILAKCVTGKVHVMFFDTIPRYYDATGKSYEAILYETKLVIAGGSTSIGCGLLAAAERRLEVDGIAVISDMKENIVPRFHLQYRPLCNALGKEVPVYLYRMDGQDAYGVDLAMALQMAGIDFQEFDLRREVDYYSLPNIVQTMRVQRYSFIDEIMACPLLTLDEVLKPVEETVTA